MNSKVNYPINLKRLVNHVVSLFNIERDDLSDLSPLYVIETLEKLDKEGTLKREIMDETSLILSHFFILIYLQRYLLRKRE